MTSYEKKHKYRPDFKLLPDDQGGKGRQNASHTEGCCAEIKKSYEAGQ